MTRLLLTAALLVAAGAAWGQKVSGGSLLKTEMDSLAYCTGIDLGIYAKKMDPSVGLNLDRVIMGIKDTREGHPLMDTEASVKLLKEHFSGEKPVAPETVSYCIGMDLGTYLNNFNEPLNNDMIAAGIRDAYAGTVIISDPHEFLKEYFTVRRPARAKEAGDKFLAGIEKSGRVKKTASGLLYEIITPGSSTLRPIDDTDIVRVHYTASLKDGTVFDSSRERNQMAEFALEYVIPGWCEGLKLIGKGGRITLYIPSELGYGERGSGGKVGPNEPLVFEIELIDVKRADK